MLYEVITVEKLDPVAHRQLRVDLKMHQAADVRGRDDVRFVGFQRFQFIAEQLPGNFRLEYRVGPGRTATQVRVLHLAQSYNFV